MSTFESSATLETIAERPRDNAVWPDEEILWFITKDNVADFCDANDEAPLSDDEMEALGVVLAEEFDSYEIIGEALHCIRGGTRRE